MPAVSLSSFSVDLSALNSSVSVLIGGIKISE